MPKQIQLRRGTTTQHATFTGAEGEVTMDTDKKTLVVHDGARAGGYPLALPTSFALNLGNLVLVDAVNGNNATAQRGQMQWPFLTLSAAQAAAVAGDTILVLPGTYHDVNLAKDGVNWHFLAGAVVEADGGPDLALFDTGPLNAGSPATFKVTGHAVFRVSEASGSVAVVSSLQATDDIALECDAIESFVPAVIAHGQLRLVCPYISVSDYPAIRLGADCTATCHLGQVLAPADGGIEIDGATATISVDDLQAGVNAVSFANGFLDLTAGQISSTAGRAVFYNVGFGGICRIRGARLVNSSDAAGPVTVNYGGYPASRLELANCHLVSLGAAAASIDAAAATNVYLYGESTANKAKHANITLVGGALTVDANLI